MNTADPRPSTVALRCALEVEPEPLPVTRPIRYNNPQIGRNVLIPYIDGETVKYRKFKRDPLHKEPRR